MLTRLIDIFVSVGTALPKAGPAGLFLGFIIWGFCILCVNECYGAVSSPFYHVLFLLTAYRRDGDFYARAQRYDHVCVQVGR